MESVPNKALLHLVNAFSALRRDTPKKLIRGSFAFRVAVRMARELHRPIYEVLEYLVTEFNCWRRCIRRNTTRRIRMKDTGDV